MKSYLAAFALATAFSPVLASAQECAKEFEIIDAQIKGAALQAAYKGREAEHPLVLRMKGGELVDLTGTIITAMPYESWTGDMPVVNKVGGFLVEAKPLIDAGKEEECVALLNKAKAEISAFDSDGSIDTQSSGSTMSN